MKLPYADNLVVPREKVTLYLLNPDHPVGGSKAVFFMRFGFRREDPDMLIAALENSWAHLRRGV